MALKPFNSVGGFSVGEIPANVILANGDIITTKIDSGTAALTLTANGNVTTFQANGQINIPSTLIAQGNITAPYFIGNVQGNISGNIVVPGTNTSVLFNDDGNANASANFTFNKSTNVLTVNGNAIVGNLNATGKVLAPTLESNVAQGTAPLTVVSTTVVANLNADLLDGYNTAVSNTINTVVVRDGNGNVSANYFIGNGSQLTGIDTSQIQNGTSNMRIATSGGNITGSVNGNANIIVITGTGVNVAGTLNATGNANVGNLGTGGLIVATGNVTGGNLTTGGALSVTGNANVGNIGATNGVLTGTLSVTGNSNVGNLGTAGLIVATGNVTGGNLTTAGDVAATGNITGGNVNTAGKVTASTLESNVAIGTAPLTVVSTTKVANLNVDLLDGYDTDVNAGGSTVVVRDVNGNVTANFFIGDGSQLTGVATAGNLANGTSNVTIPVANGNINMSVNGNANVVVVTDTGVNVAGTLNATGNANVGNIGAASGVLTGTLSVTGNSNVGNLGTAGSIIAGGNITSNANVVTDFVVSRTNSITIEAIGVDQNVFLKPTGTGSVDVWSKIISNVATPVAASDAATKAYVDSVAEGLHVQASVAAATDDTLANISSGTVTYNNGTAGVGATLVTTGTYATIDGVNIATVGTRILVKNQANLAHNGIYTYTNSTTLTRATDYDTAAEIQGGDFTFVTGGTLYNSTGWVQIDPVTTVGTDPIEWEQFSGAGTYLAGTGLTLTGDTFSISDTTVTAASYGNGDAVATFTVNAQGQLTAASNVAITANAANLSGTALNANINSSNLTSVGTLTSLTVSGNASAGNLSTGGALSVTGNITAGNANLGNLVVANFFSGDGSLLTNVSATGSLANGTSNVRIPVANGNVNISASGNANILVVTGLGANITGYANITGNVTTGNLNGGNLVTANFLAGTLTTAAQPNITSVGTLSSLTVTGTATAGNLSTGGNLSVTGNANVGNLGTTGLITATGNITGGNLTTGGVVTATGNVSGGNLTTGGVVTATGNVSGGNITTTGVVTATGNVSGGNLTTTGAAAITGNVTAGNVYANTGTVGANIANIGSRIDLGNTKIGWATVTTTTVTANQTIATISTTGITGVEFIVKGVDSSGAKYSVATVQAVTNGTNTDYATFGTVNLGGSTGSLAVNVSDSNLVLQVTPASTNSTVWTTQFRTV